MRMRSVWLVSFAAVAACAAIAAPVSDVLAHERRHGGPREVIVIGHDRYNYHDGRFFRPGWFGLEVALDFSPIGAVVVGLPEGYTTVMIGGETYYCYGGTYYRRHPTGYIVVPEPVVVPVVVTPAVAAPAVPATIPVVAQPAAPVQVQAAAVNETASSGNEDAVVINVPNSNGSYTPVRLIKRYKGYEGPQGEFYPEHPTVEQLKVLYGK